MWRSVASNGLTVLIVAVFCLAAAILWGKRQYNTAGPLEAPICLRVEGGQKIRDVASGLAEQGAISNESIFKMGADYSGRSRDLKAGSFLVGEAATMSEIVEAITGSGRSTCGTEINLRVGVGSSRLILSELDPESNRYIELASFDPLAEDVTAPEIYADKREDQDVRFRMTFAEGVTSWQMVQAMNAADFLDGEIETIPEEGTLAPDSYELVEGSDRAGLIERMTAKQDEILAESWQSRADGLPLASAEEALILASIIEKETGLPEERGVVASVFINRLEQGIRLQTDPTVIYGITKGQRVLGRGLRQSELRGETPWNTYVIDGLPPTPIANPGRAAIEAALNPDTSEFLFFVADGTGGHAFAQTLSEHNENVAKWREIEAQQQEN